MSGMAVKIRLENPRDGYVAHHAPRYAFLLRLLSKYVKSDSRILDIGRSKLTDLMADAYRVPVDSLGFGRDGETRTGYHYQFDLNHTCTRERWRRDLQKYGIIVMAEVIEHLYTSPSHVFRFLKSRMRAKGILIVQTPNAIALHKRIKMLLGYNPFGLISEDTANPAHFREYTRTELLSYAAQLDLAVLECVSGNYFDYRFFNLESRPAKNYWYLGLINWVYGVLPGTFRPGITLVLKLK